MKCEGIKKMPPEKAVHLLAEDGLEVDVAKAKIILDFLYKIADIVVDQYLDQKSI